MLNDTRTRVVNGKRLPVVLFDDRFSDSSSYRGEIRSRWKSSTSSGLSKEIYGPDKDPAEIQQVVPRGREDSSVYSDRNPIPGHELSFRIGAGDGE